MTSPTTDHACGCPAPRRGSPAYRFHILQACSQQDPGQLGQALDWVMHHYRAMGLAQVMAYWLVIIEGMTPGEYRDSYGVPDTNMYWEHINARSGALLHVANNDATQVREWYPQASQHAAWTVAYESGKQMLTTLDVWRPVFHQCLTLASQYTSTREAEQAVYARLMTQGPGLRPLTLVATEAAHLLHVAARPFIGVLTEKGTLPPSQKCGCSNHSGDGWPEPDDMILADHGHTTFTDLYEMRLRQDAAAAFA